MWVNKCFDLFKVFFSYGTVVRRVPIKRAGKRKGKDKAEDIMIAAIAKTHGEKVVTRDAHYSKIHGLKMLKY